MAKFVCSFISHTLLRTVDITVLIPSVTIPEALTARGGLPGMQMSAPTQQAQDALCYAGRAPYPVLLC